MVPVRSGLLLLALTATSAAQGQREVLVGDYDEAYSRTLFAACDRNGDGDLDLLEAGQAFDALDGTRGRERFRRLDRDRNGFLGLAEFDRHYQEIVARGSQLKLQTVRPVAALPRPAKASAIPRQIQLFDQDRDGELSKAEMEQLLVAANLPPVLLAQVDLDRDRSGTYSAAELGPVLPFLKVPGLENAPARPAVALLPAPYDAWDQDGSGAVDAAEFAQALRRVDPQLARWAAELLRSADRNTDGRLVAEELQATAPPPRAVADQAPRR